MRSERYSQIWGIAKPRDLNGAQVLRADERAEVSVANWAVRSVCHPCGKTRSSYEKRWRHWRRLGTCRSSLFCLAFPKTAPGASVVTSRSRGAQQRADPLSGRRTPASRHEPEGHM